MAHYNEQICVGEMGKMECVVERKMGEEDNSCAMDRGGIDSSKEVRNRLI